MDYKITKKISKARIDEILRIKNEAGLTANAILGAAKKKNNVLHDLFDWDNTEAAEKWRLHQARMLINEVKIIINTKEYYAFENLSISVEESETDNNREYVSHDEIITNEDLRKQIIQKALESLIYWRNKYSHYSEFKSIITEIDRVNVILQQEAEQKIST
jgi:hypothetical protein